MSSFFSGVKQRLRVHLVLVIFCVNLFFTCVGGYSLFRVFGLLGASGVGLFPLDIVSDFCLRMGVLGFLVGFVLMFTVFCFVVVVKRYGLGLWFRGKFGGC